MDSRNSFEFRKRFSNVLNRKIDNKWRINNEMYGLWSSARFKVVCHSGMTGSVPTYCCLGTRILLFNRAEHKYDHEVTRKTLFSLCPRLAKKAANGLRRKEKPDYPQKGRFDKTIRMTEGLAPIFFEDEALLLFHGGLEDFLSKSCGPRFSPCQDAGHEFQIWGFPFLNAVIWQGSHPESPSSLKVPTGSHPNIKQYIVSYSFNRYIRAAYILIRCESSWFNWLVFLLDGITKEHNICWNTERYTKNKVSSLMSPSSPRSRKPTHPLKQIRNTTSTEYAHLHPHKLTKGERQTPTKPAIHHIWINNTLKNLSVLPRFTYE